LRVLYTFCDIDDNLQLRLNQETLDALKDCPEEIAYLESVIRTIPNVDNPQTLDQFNYHYVDGKLVNRETDKPFHWVNQKHYDSLGDIIIGHIQKLMVEECDMDEVKLPMDEMDEYDGPYNNIFVSKNVYTCDKLLLLNQGSGAVRAGMWARALCINNDLSLGSVIPYIKKGYENGFGVIVLNPNLNSNYVPPKEVKRQLFLGLDVNIEEPDRVKIKGNGSPVEHVLYVWDRIVSKCVANRICIVAHSAGGHGAVQLLRNREEEVNKKVCGIAFTDSVHSIGSRDSKSVQKFIKDRCRNWVTSDEDIDTVVNKPFYDCICVSAGHTKHEFTSGCAIEAVFKFLIEKSDSFMIEN